MSIVIKAGAELKPVSPSPFKCESELEQLLAHHPKLLGIEATQIAFVGRQINLPDAGILDLLFVSREGLPIAVEVKLACNAQSRREVIAQAIDYLSSLTELTVDELDIRVDNQLDEALHELAGDDDSEFEKMWAAVGKNLRNGDAKLVVALDEAPSAASANFSISRSQVGPRCSVDHASALRRSGWQRNLRSLSCGRSSV